MKNSTSDCYLPEPSNNIHGHLGLILVENCFFFLRGKYPCSHVVVLVYNIGSSQVEGLWSVVSHYFMCTCKFLS